ncbi:MAG: signal peptidase II [Phascolarctobacterium sp.]|nr:signal peptidase II [Phascolarctobacterium sp.]
MYLVTIALLVIIVDQMTKHFVAAHFCVGESIPVISDFFHWTYILNSGAAFGIFEGRRWLFIIIAVVVISVMLLFYRDIRAGDKTLQLGVALFAGGAIGNLIDRMVIGLVIDFFDFRIWPVFNVADIAICIGIGLIIWSIIKTEYAVGRNA